MAIAGKISDDLPPGTWNSIPKQAGLKGVSKPMTRYAVVFEKAESKWAAYVPDLPGCVATAATLEGCKYEIGEAIRFHLEGMREDGIDIPLPSSVTDYVAA